MTTTSTTSSAGGLPVSKPAVKAAAPKTGTNPNFGMNMPLMSSAFDTAAWLSAA